MTFEPLNVVELVMLMYGDHSTGKVDFACEWSSLNNEDTL
jgi:hypothetical protein